MEPQQSDAHTEVGVVGNHAKNVHDEEPQHQGVESDFDPEQFAALLKNQLIAYNFSWDPLMRALESLAASMVRQQRTQKSNNNALDDMREQVHALRDRLDQSEHQKQESVSALAQLQDEVAGLRNELFNARQDQHAQQEEIQKLKEARLEQPSPGTSGDLAAAPTTAYASADDLKTVKQALTNQLRKSLSAVFGEQFIVNDEDDDMVDMDADRSVEGSQAEAVIPGSADTVNGISDTGADRPPSRPGTGVSGVLRTPLPGVPFASEAVVKAELDKLRELQAAMEAKLAAQKTSMEALDDRVGTMDVRLDAAQQQRRNSKSIVIGNPELLQKQIDELKDQQTALLQQIKEQAQTVDKQASGFKELVATLDDITLQQQMLSARPAGGTEGSARASGSDTSGPPQLDLSLVFTKIADLRRATDASIDQIQQSVREAADSTSTQQAQLDALRHAIVFNELQKLRLLEARLALQKELLDRNQTHQDRTKPLLAEWKKQLEQTEEKLQHGLCDQDVMDEMQQLQRNYHRTMLTMTPLINSPLMIAESLQKLADEVKDVQGGVQSGTMSVLLNGSSSGDARLQRVEEFATKLQYLDEEVDATQQVNVVTEKKNDPLLKSLDTMRDKLESMWSLWHQNLIKRKSSSGSDTSPRIDPSTLSSSEGMRDVELRLMGAVRRVNSLEEEVDRLGGLMSTSSASQGVGVRTSADDIVKLRKDMQDEIQRLSHVVAGLQASSSALVPTAPSGRSTNRSPDPASASRGDLVGDLHAQMLRRGGRDIDGRFHEESEDGGPGVNTQRTTYDALLKDLTKRVTQAVMQHLDKSGGARGGPAGIGANPNVNFRTLLENFTQKFDERLEDTREFTIEELTKLRKELLDLLKAKLEAALRDLRAEFMMIYYPPAGGGENGGDSTAVGTKPVMCVACSRPVPVSGVIREPGTYPSAELIAEQTSSLLHAELEYDRSDEDFVFRAGFKMPADRKTMTLPFLANNIRNRIALNKIDRKPRRPARQHPHGNPVDNVVREAMELDRKQRHIHGMPPSPPK